MKYVGGKCRESTSRSFEPALTGGEVLALEMAFLILNECGVLERVGEHGRFTVCDGSACIGGKGGRLAESGYDLRITDLYDQDPPRSIFLSM